MVFPPSLPAGALPAVIDWLEAMSGRGDRSLRTPGFSAAAEQLPEHADQDIGGVRHSLPGPPGDVHIGPHHDAAVFVDFALPIPVGIDVLRVTAGGTDADDVDSQAVRGCDRGRSRRPALAADAGEQR